MKISFRSLLRPLFLPRKNIVVYCSIIPHHTPPFSWYNSARRLSEQFPVIFIDLPGIPQRAGFWGILRCCRWFAQSIRTRSTFLVWDLSCQLSPSLLFVYLLVLKYLCSYRIVLLTNVPSPYPIYRFVPFNISCFECADHYYATEFSENRTRIREFDMVFTNTRLLFDEMTKFSPRVRHISSGYAEELKASCHKTPKIAKSVIFSGGISHRIDYRLLDKLVTTLPDHQFFFMGEVYLLKYYIEEERDKRSLQAWRQLLQRPNVHYLGAFSSEQSTYLLPLFEVGIIPYDVTDLFNYHSHPVKLYEYLAAGLPVVSTPLPSMLEYVERAPVHIADNAHQMAQVIRGIDFIAVHFKEKNLQQVQRILDEQSVARKVKQITDWIREMV